MWALDCLLRERHLPVVSIGALRAQFRKHIPIGVEATVSLLEETSEGFSLSIAIDVGVVTLIQGRWEAASRNVVVPEGLGNRSACEEWNFGKGAETRGVLPLQMDANLFRRLFPALARSIPHVQAAEIMATTRLVGMVCPGLHSLFVSLDLKPTTGDSNATELAYGVRRVNPRVKSVNLAVSGPTLQGAVASLVRPSPQVQPSMSEVRQALGDISFSDQRAIVVGGSRGIGEVTAKCIAAGGGSTVITYFRGEKDAKRVVEDIKAAGGRAYAVALDCLQPISRLDELLSQLGAPTHLYYFATPPISVNAKQAFSAAIFREMAMYYVEGFARLVEAVHLLSANGLTVCYPSTIFLNEIESGTGEYCAAKAAGEYVCRFLGKALAGTRFYAPRLPRMRTDQTMSILPVKSLEPLKIILEVLRLMKGDSTSDNQESSAGIRG
jgi:NADP-dependent 3-hydroxy acid dehydrogenase YdfG